ncbi:hypothetical protein BC936DRAFT_145931 [Jimgerdemannia flammicorona]|uniref:Uncharacterized protein n=1 Tax=Jimgerdemannia flammicorona TaxID=994334 RepID=A0A433D8S5_9FUNG|nr:hypothetical protein BC936DRAFT_145931 [Jimgerdemannia flammicorona]
MNNNAANSDAPISPIKYYRHQYDDITIPDASTLPGNTNVNTFSHTVLPQGKSTRSSFLPNGRAGVKTHSTTSFHLSETTVNVTADALDPSDLVVALGGSWILASDGIDLPGVIRTGGVASQIPGVIRAGGLVSDWGLFMSSFRRLWRDASWILASVYGNDFPGAIRAAGAAAQPYVLAPDRDLFRSQAKEMPVEDHPDRAEGKGIECIFDRPRPPRKLSPSPSTEGVPSASTKGVNIPSASTEGASTDLPYLPQPSSAPLFDANGLPTLFIIEYLNTFVQKDPSSAPLFDMNDYPTIVSMFEYFNAPPWLQNEHDLKGRGMQQFNEVILQGGDPGLESASASTQPSNPVRSQEPHPTSDNPQGIADFDTKVLQNQKPTLPSSENVLLSQQPSHMAEQSSISNRLGPAQPEEITAEKKKKWLIQAHIILTGLIHISYGPNAIP